MLLSLELDRNSYYIWRLLMLLKKLPDKKDEIFPLLDNPNVGVLTLLAP